MLRALLRWGQSHSHNSHNCDPLVRPAGSPSTERACKDGLVNIGVPTGLAAQLAQEDGRIGKRMYLLDNSCSMAEVDGSSFIELEDGKLQLKECTRWEECCCFARDHAHWNLACGTPCEFVLLNTLRVLGQPPKEGIDFVCLHDARAGSNKLNDLLQRTNPRGATPLAFRLQEIRTRIQAEAHELAARGQMVFLTIVTDGLPTSTVSETSTLGDRQALAQELRLMCRELPVQLVIRLCTNDNKVMDFYSSLDREMDVPMDVLDDIAGEAQELTKLGNDWFAYTPLLHRIREAGTLCKIFDNLDEKRLSRGEVRRFASLLCTCNADPSAHRALDDKAFAATAGRDAREAPPVYNPLAKSMTPYLDERKLRRALGVGGLFGRFCPCCA